MIAKMIPRLFKNGAKGDPGAVLETLPKKTKTGTLKSLATKFPTCV